jgi:hypothetical protein
VQVLKHYSYVQLIGQMTYYTQALGVQCSYCHNVNNFAYDTATKRISRTMQIMSSGVQHAWVEPAKRDYPNYAVTGAVGCVTCHRGQPHMAVKWNVVPVQYLNSTNKSTRQVGYVVNSMYSAAKSLGVNCLFCHNSADFVSLQYYPTNKIAHRMWAMVDDINHKYLPANIKAVTCYTCHQGNKWPNALVKAGLDQTPVQAIAAHPDVQENPGAHLASGLSTASWIYFGASRVSRLSTPRLRTFRSTRSSPKARRVVTSMVPFSPTRTPVRKERSTVRRGRSR